MGLGYDTWKKRQLYLENMRHRADDGPYGYTKLRPMHSKFRGVDHDCLDPSKHEQLGEIFIYI